MDEQNQAAEGTQTAPEGEQGNVLPVSDSTGSVTPASDLSANPSTTGTDSDSTTNAGSDLPNDPVSDVLDQSAASTSDSAPAASGDTSEAAGTEPHPAHAWLDLLVKELKTNPFSVYALELIAKARATL
jgi:hypothetical protein